MTKTNFEKVIEFNDGFGVTVNNTLQKDVFKQEPSLVKLRLDLILEEVKELKDAVDNHDMTETIDALADILYVVYGAGASFGINLDKAFDIVHKSNMSKLCETEEDAIMPILPLIRESMVRSHARGIENALLLGNHSDGQYTSGIFDGLLQMAQADSDFTDDVGAGSPAAFAATDKVLASDLLGMRKNMGKYGVNPNDVVYLVSQDAYYNLLEDAEFQDVNLVGDLSTKLSGEIGQVFGSRVILCDEFPAKAAAKFAAVAVYTRNYVMPRLRGVTIESDYDVENQRRVLVASQRLGFADIIAGATSKWGFKYDAS